MSKRSLRAALATTLLASGLAIAAPPVPAGAAGSVGLTAFGVPVTESFDGLALTGTSSTTPLGWAFVESGTNANTTYTAGTGSSTAGDTYSFGAAGSTERAFGSLRSGSLIATIGASFTNATGGTITDLAVAFTGEQWRAGVTNRGAADRLDFEYSTTATSLTDGTWTAVDALDFSSPNTAATAGALDGNALSNRTAISATISGLSVANGATVWVRWVDSDIASSDDGLAVDDVSVTAAGTVSPTDSAPAVASTVPASGASAVVPSQTLSVSFTEPVSLADPWYSLACASVGAVASTWSGSGAAYAIDPTADLPFGDTCTLTVLASAVTDTDATDPPDAMEADATVTFTTDVDVCAQPFTPIPAIQGSGATAAITGTVTTQGVVVADFEGPSPALRGFFLQDASGDGDPATSDGIFVFEGSNADTVAVGDVVRVTGTAGENQGQTQVSVGTIRHCGTGTVAPTDVTFPLAAADALEPVEGMLVRLPQTMYVTEHFQLGRFGQVVLSSGGRLQQPTSVVSPGAEAQALQAANNLNRIIVDDASQTQNPDPIVWGRNGLPLSASNTLRGGDTATGIVGVMTYTWAGNAASGNAYRIRPIGSLGGTAQFVAANERPVAPPAVGGTVQVVGMNLLNYFNSFGTTGCTAGVGGAVVECRGASDAAEFARQNAKTVAAILALDPDVLGVNELENDGYGPTSALQDLVDRLNAATAPGTYAFIDADANTGQVNAMGNDAIRVAQIYKPSVVTPVGQTAVLNTPEFVNGGDSAPRSRPTIAQAYRVNATGAVFVVDVNHLKSKGSACDAPDAGDGQGNCNTVRVNAATALVQWLATDPTGTGDPDVLLVGDYNSYAREDPITVLRNAGFTNLVEQFLGDDAYSYVFDGQWGYLDQALASTSLVGQVTGVGDDHINADEPSVLDYLTDFKSAGQQVSLYAPDQYRVSDHDPVIVGLDPNAPPTVGAGGPYSVAEGGSVALSATGSDPNGDALTYEWDLDGDGSFESTGATVSFSAAGLDGPTTRTVTVRATDSGGLVATDTATVDVSNAAPTVAATFTTDRTACGNGNGVLDVTWSDPGAGDTHTVVVDWGDGTAVQTFTAATSPLHLTHTYARARTYTATVRVSDDDGATTIASDRIGVNFFTTGFLPPLANDGSSSFKRGAVVPVSVLLVDCNLSVPSGLAPVMTVTKLGASSPSITTTMSFVVAYATLLRTNQLAGAGTYVVTVTVPQNGQVITTSFTLRA